MPIETAKSGADLTTDDWILILVTSVDKYKAGEPKTLNNIASIMQKVGSSVPEIKF